jgi:hypothetical protein
MLLIILTILRIINDLAEPIQNEESKFLIFSDKFLNDP